MANKNPRLENLKPFKKGHDERRNLNGAPKLPDLVELMAKVLGEEKEGKSAAEVIIAAQRAKAAKGDTRAAEWLFNRGYGMTTQQIQHSGSVENPIILKLDERFNDTGIST